MQTSFYSHARYAEIGSIHYLQKMSVVGSVNSHFVSQKWSKCPFLAKTLTKYIEKIETCHANKFL